MIIQTMLIIPSTLRGQTKKCVNPHSPSATCEALPIAEYQEWPFQGFLKRTRIGNETTYNLEFKLPCVLERLNLPIPGEALAYGRILGGKGPEHENRKSIIC
jgi:hypothetical protein